MPHTDVFVAVKTCQRFHQDRGEVLHNKETYLDLLSRWAVCINACLSPHKENHSVFCSLSFASPHSVGVHLSGGKHLLKFTASSQQTAEIATPSVIIQNTGICF